MHLIEHSFPRSNLSVLQTQGFKIKNQFIWWTDTCLLGMKPHFLVIGAQKCGTTSLSNYFRNEPQVFLPAHKELHFFSKDAEKLTDAGIRSYLRNFDNARPDQFIGEATPNYLPSRFAPEKVAAVLPTVRLIVILRDPIERAVSAFLHAQRIRAIPKSLTFEKAIERDARMKGSPWTNTLNYGFYFRSLNHWLNYFDHGQIHISLLEDIRSKFAPEINKIYQHLGLPIDSESMRDFPHLNQARNLIAPQISRFLDPRLKRTHPIQRALNRSTGHSVRRPEPLPETMNFLRDLYAEQILKLESLIQRDLTIWPSHPENLESQQ